MRSGPVSVAFPPFAQPARGQSLLPLRPSRLVARHRLWREPSAGDRPFPDTNVMRPLRGLAFNYPSFARRNVHPDANAAGHGFARLFYDPSR